MATKVTREQLVAIGEAFEDLLIHYGATSIEVFQKHKSRENTTLVILFKDDKNKVVAQREFPKKEVEVKKDSD